MAYIVFAARTRRQLVSVLLYSYSAVTTIRSVCVWHQLDTGLSPFLSSFFLSLHFFIQLQQPAVYTFFSFFAFLISLSIFSFSICFHSSVMGLVAAPDYMFVLLQWQVVFKAGRI